MMMIVDVMMLMLNIFHRDHSILVHVWIRVFLKLCAGLKFYIALVTELASLRTFRFVESEHVMVEENDLLRGRFVKCFVLICYLSYCF